MDKILKPNKLAGMVTVPSSKSQGHRALIAAALAGGTSRLLNLFYSEDIIATKNALALFGAVAKEDDGALFVTGAVPCPADDAIIDCGESGSTIRFLIPLAWISGKR